VKLYAVRIFVFDFPRACDFYGGTLGLSERMRLDEAGWAEFDVGGVALGIERIDRNDPEADLVGRFVGISLSIEDMDAAYARLCAADVVFEAPPERQPWGGTLAHFRDPDGNVLTLIG
jgi:catechol 2,3-dioxygenase-like lactoylglutathione lyase family enzyme